MAGVIVKDMELRLVLRSSTVVGSVPLPATRLVAIEPSLVVLGLNPVAVLGLDTILLTLVTLTRNASLE